jgi:sugar phosphate isomerase/epimerase
MTKYRISVNMEFVRSSDLDFRAGIRVAAKLGYRYVEPMVHTGWELLSEVGYYHSFSMEEDPLLMKELCQQSNLRVSSFSAHSPLMKPEAAVPRLTRAIQFADYNDSQFINTDEMLKPEWMTDELAHQAMHYSLMKSSLVARRHKVFICIEPHGVYTKTAAGLLKIVDLVESPWIGVNWDTGNSYLAGIEDPYEGLMFVRDRVRHLHAKDISLKQSEEQRGKVTGTPVGCACGEGVVDWDKVFSILDPLDRELFLSVECGTIEQAERSLSFLQKAVGASRLAT